MAFFRCESTFSYKNLNKSLEILDAVDGLVSSVTHKLIIINRLAVFSEILLMLCIFVELFVFWIVYFYVEEFVVSLLTKLLYPYNRWKVRNMNTRLSYVYTLVLSICYHSTAVSWSQWQCTCKKTASGALNILRLRQNGWHFADNIWKFTLLFQKFILFLKSDYIFIGLPVSHHWCR